MELKRLLEAIEYIKIQGKQDIDIEGIYYDSREVTPGSLFFCIDGFTVDGHDFALEAAKKGAKALVLERDIDVKREISKIFVTDSKIAMAHMAREYYENPARKISLIGVTGTNGKTTVTHLIKSILEEAGQKVGLIGTITNMIGKRKIPSRHTTPESLDLQRLLAQMVKEGVDSVVMEVSSHSLVLKRVEGCLFDIGVFTNLSQDHLDFHKNMEEYRDAKAKLFNQSNFAIINTDDENGRWIRRSVTGDLYTFGISMEADVFARDLEITDRGVTFNLYSPHGNSSISLDLGIPGIFSIYNALAAAGVCYRLGISSSIIARGLTQVKGINGRFELLDTGGDYSVILDYAHTPDGLENILKTVKEYAKGRIITLFGCGGDRDQLKRPIMGEIAGKYSDYCIITSDNPRGENPRSIIMEIVPGVEKSQCPYKIIEDRKEAIKYGLDHILRDDVLILAGKGHETYQILGDKTIPFDEKEIVFEILKNKP